MSASKPTPDQLRAKHAWEVVQAAMRLYPHAQPKSPGGKREAHEDAKRFGGAARKLPVRIMASGLGQSLAFLAAKGVKREAYQRLLEFIGDWVLNRPRDGTPSRQLPADDAQLYALIERGTADTLREQTVETLAYLQWLNRFCEAEGLTADVED
jgi:CRISPR-associated protein Cmr5